MPESILLIVIAAVAVVVLLSRLSRGAKRRNVVDPASLDAELKHLAHSKKHARDNLTDTQANQIPPAEQAAPDRLYLADANIADVVSGHAFREFARKKYKSGTYPMPNAAQMDRIAAEIDGVAKRKSEYIQTRPIAVIRKSRSIEDVTTDETSWFGGKPMLGTAVWPRTSKGVPMHHWASINLADLRKFMTPPGLPEQGRLVFFVHVIDPPYEGKVLYIADGDNFSQPPTDLPIIDHDSTFIYDLVDYTKDDAPTEHPLWPVEFIDLPMDGSKEGHQKAFQILADFADRLPDRYTWHQMFGEGVSRQVAREDHPYDHMLLQLEGDDKMMGAWGGGAVVQFWISPDDLRHQNWEAVTVTMESD